LAFISGLTFQALRGFTLQSGLGGNFVPPFIIILTQFTYFTQQNGEAEKQCAIVPAV